MIELLQLSIILGGIWIVGAFLVSVFKPKPKPKRKHQKVQGWGEGYDDYCPIRLHSDDWFNRQ